jgi:hypothetical protein
MRYLARSGNYQLSGENCRYDLVMRSFWIPDNFRIMGVSAERGGHFNQCHGDALVLRHH